MTKNEYLNLSKRRKFYHQLINWKFSAYGGQWRMETPITSRQKSDRFPATDDRDFDANTRRVNGSQDRVRCQLWRWPGLQYHRPCCHLRRRRRTLPAHRGSGHIRVTSAESFFLVANETLNLASVWEGTEEGREDGSFLLSLIIGPR